MASLLSGLENRNGLLLSAGASQSSKISSPTTSRASGHLPSIREQGVAMAPNRMLGGQSRLAQGLDRDRGDLFGGLSSSSSRSPPVHYQGSTGGGSASISQRNFGTSSPSPGVAVPSSLLLGGNSGTSRAAHINPARPPERRSSVGGSTTSAFSSPSPRAAGLPHVDVRGAARGGGPLEIQMEIVEEEMPQQMSTASAVSQTSNMGRSMNMITSSTTRPTSPTTAPTPKIFTRKMIGLRNLGNTCFMNSILQCLMSVPPFVAYFKDRFSLSDINDATMSRGTHGQLAREFKAFLEEAAHARSMSALSPASLRNVMIKFAPQFQGFQQHDAHEALRFLLDGLHEDLNRVKRKPPYVELKERKGESLDEAAQRWWDYSWSCGNSVITDIFGGQFLQETHCGFCDHRSWAFDTFLDLSLPVPVGLRGGNGIRDITLTDCLREFTDRETLDVQDYKCENCKRAQRITKRMGIYKPPRVLVIHLKRFSWHSRRKIDATVHFPVTNLDIGEFVEQNGEFVERVNNTASRSNSLFLENPLRASSPTSGASSSGYHHSPNQINQKAGGKYAKNYIYDLCGVSQHVGSMGGGHYTACCRVGEHHWSSVSDSNVQSCSSENDAVDASAYVLFYVRRM
mmetsp:Transcript_343/g.681  ORF Transcript_343/g.681 Transcript_343/m.681 type:complete len:627 (+) Transcript_343:393-2273(+)|eukprot:CAMPEP_0178998266 /NCGR_PEP_ID=MMETSP0795-20121207/9425_1 /TAXON_ID=88552 /ORGANISM="Amoebophrya sp., Strain Ameob2" /LENGTH=626 /DNA_ID=CAMNT_0020690941 /DNA_START=333 /DNA_END=2216 /DNA_ORIENTATION=-